MGFNLATVWKFQHRVSFEDQQTIDAIPWQWKGLCLVLSGQDCCSTLGSTGNTHGRLSLLLISLCCCCPSWYLAISFYLYFSLSSLHWPSSVTGPMCVLYMFRKVFFSAFTFYKRKFISTPKPPMWHSGSWCPHYVCPYLLGIEDIPVVLAICSSTLWHSSNRIFDICLPRSWG